ncbi:hypothetical protein Egran_06653, partial [Elaphomyces granulatus]
PPRCNCYDDSQPKRARKYNDRAVRTSCGQLPHVGRIGSCCHSLMNMLSHFASPLLHDSNDVLLLP